MTILRALPGQAANAQLTLLEDSSFICHHIIIFPELAFLLMLYYDQLIMMVWDLIPPDGTHNLCRRRQES